MVAIAGLCLGAARAGQTPLLATKEDGKVVNQVAADGVKGRTLGWQFDQKTQELTFRPAGKVTSPVNGTLYLAVTCLDNCYGDLSVRFKGKDGKQIAPDRGLGGACLKTGKRVTSMYRFQGLDGSGDSVVIHYNAPKPDGYLMLGTGAGVPGAGSGGPVVLGVMAQDTPPDDAQFRYVLTDPWKGPYTGPSIKADNSTLKGKVMVGYQGWFRTPNDPCREGWGHWGDILHGMYNTDMWPDVSQYPPQTLAKAAEVKTRSGKTAYLFSSAWPEVADLHFRWMRENDIDGAFVQRFITGTYTASGRPDWVLAAARAAANREGRIWAIEYDVSGGRDATIVDMMQKDWKYLVDTVGILKDPNYAHENGKPVVFIWGLPVPDRHFTSGTSNAVVDFFKNDPKYGGNYVIGGIISSWRTMDAGWQEHFKKYDAIQPWMSRTYADDAADFAKMGVTYVAHANPGFSWSNMHHYPVGSTQAFKPREGGQLYWDSLCALSQAKVDRLCVGMFDEFDESTAIMPMSDDPPATPSRPGTCLQYHPALGKTFKTVTPTVSLDFSARFPFKNVSGSNCGLSWGGVITPPKAGDYTFYIQGAAGDFAALSLNDKPVIGMKNFGAAPSAGAKITVAAGEKVIYQLSYYHHRNPGTARLLWEGPGIPLQPVPAWALTDAWGRFLTNEGHPSDWWLKLTRYGKEMMNGKRPIDPKLPES